MRHAIGVAPDARFRREAWELLDAGISRHGAIEEIGAGQRRDDDQREDEPRRPFDQPPPHSLSLATSRRQSNLMAPLAHVAEHDAYSAKFAMTGAWSDGRSQPRASRRTRIDLTASPSAGLTQMWSRRRPLFTFDQSGER